MMTHPYNYDRLVAERHAQIQRDMQLSRVQVSASQPSADQSAQVTRLNPRAQKLSATEQKNLLRAS